EYTSAANTNSPVGTYDIVPSLLDPDGKLGNYSVSSTNGTLTVNPAALVGIADDKSRPYGQTNPVFTVHYIGFVNDEDDSVLSAESIGSPPADETSPIGTYPISGSGQSNANYSITYSNGTLTVTAHALTVVADNTSRPYGQTNPVFTGSVAGVQNGDNI